MRPAPDTGSCDNTMPVSNRKTFTRSSMQGSNFFKLCEAGQPL